MTVGTPSSAQLAEVTYLTGVGTSGTLVSPAFSAWNQDYPATYNSSTSYTRKWADNPNGTEATSSSAAGTPGGNVTYAFDPSSSFTPVEQQAFIASLTLWSDEANIQFTQVSAGSDPDVLLSLGDNTGTYEGSAPASSAVIGSTSIPDNLTPTASYNHPASITFDTSGQFGTLGSFSPGADNGYSSLIHEVGHLLGLGHSGPYSDSAKQAQVDQAQLSPFDSRQWSVMSYIQPDDVAAKYFSQYTVPGTNWTATYTSSTANGATTTYYYPIAPQTPMPLDVLAAQQLYGLPTTTALSGGQIFGFNCNISDASEPFFDFSKNVEPVVTLWDAGTGNTLDLSGYTSASSANLNPGTFSSVNGLTNNIGIAFGTMIDTVIGGSGNDTFIANADSDHIDGGGGTNTVVFADQRAAYTITGTVGSLQVTNDNTGIVDRLAKVQTLEFADGTAYTLASNASDFNGDGTSDILFQNTNGTVDTWELNNASVIASTLIANPGTSWHEAGTGDFNGDGYSDILYQNDDGTVAIWELNGSTVTLGANVANPGTSWHIIGTGDFNEDGKSDILFQNNNGTVEVWNMNGASVASSAVVANPGTQWHAIGAGDFFGTGQPDILLQNDDGTIDIWQMSGDTLVNGTVIANPGPTWHAVGTGDFNGDGKSDILFQNNDGSIAVWEMNGTTVTSGVVVANPGPSWHAVSTGDYNGDGKSDILLQNDNGTVEIWQMSGTTVTAGTVVANPGTQWQTTGQGSMHFIDGTQSTGAVSGTILADDFVFTTSQQGAHIINGFDQVHDVITLNQAQFGSYAAVQAAETTVNGSTVITLGTNDTLTINGVLPGALAAKNFV